MANDKYYKLIVSPDNIRSSPSKNTCEIYLKISGEVKDIKGSYVTYTDCCPFPLDFEKGKIGLNNKSLTEITKEAYNDKERELRELSGG